MKENIDALGFVHDCSLCIQLPQEGRLAQPGLAWLGMACPSLARRGVARHHLASGTTLGAPQRILRALSVASLRDPQLFAASALLDFASASPHFGLRFTSNFDLSRIESGSPHLDGSADFFIHLNVYVRTYLYL